MSETIEIFQKLGVEPFDYQVTGAEFLAGPNKFYYLADKPGLGKTLQTIASARLTSVRTILVICPAAIIGQWQSQLRGFARAQVVSYESLALSPVKKHTASCYLRDRPAPPWPTEKNAPAPVCRGCGFEFPRPDVVHRKQKAQALRRSLKENGPWDLIVFDEAHFLKERGSNRTAYLLHKSYGIVNAAKKGVLLSGTPILNRPAELFPILRACFPEAIADCAAWEQYAYKFCAGGPGWNGSLEANGASNLDELGQRLRPFMLARDESVLGDRLPPLTIVDQDIDIERIISKADHIATRRRETGEAKISQLIEAIAEVAAKCGKLVVFYYHKTVLAPLQRRFPHAPVIKGGMTSYQKAGAVGKFQSIAFSSVMIVQLGAGGIGLDGLQHSASTGYIAELDWTPALLEQAIGRLRRLGQQHPVTIYRPIGHKQGLDLHIRGLLNSKAKVISDVMGHVTMQATVTPMITREDIQVQRDKGMTAVRLTLDELETVIDQVERENKSMEQAQFDALLNKLDEVGDRIIDALAGQPTQAKPRSRKKKEEPAEEEACFPSTEGPVPPETAAPATEPAPVDVAISTPVQPEAVPAQPAMTFEQARDLLTAEIESDPEKSDARYILFQDELKARKLEKMGDLAEDQVEDFVNTLLAKFSGVGAPKYALA